MNAVDHIEKHCQRKLRQLCEYLDGELEDDLCTELERHLSQCYDCRIMLDTLGKTLTLYRRFNQTTLPRGARERLKSALSKAGCL